MKVALVLYPDCTTLDLVGPYEVISRWPGAEVHFVAGSPDAVRCDKRADGAAIGHAGDSA